MLLLIGLLLSSLIAALAYRGRALSKSGALGAVIVGTITFGLGGWVWGLLLIAFFFLSSLFSRYREREKERLAEKFAKGHRRDWGQVLANGGLGALLAVTRYFHPAEALFVAFLGSMAAVTADTWATELGVLSPKPPRLLTNGKVVPVGTPGGVTLWGLVATLLGGAVMGGLAYLFLAVERAFGSTSSSLQIHWMMLLTLLSGLCGSLFDSLLGATLQGIYLCPACEVETERTKHRCGRATLHLRGWPWLNNDLVNFASSLVGAGMAFLFYRFLMLK